MAKTDNMGKNNNSVVLTIRMTEQVYNTIQSSIENNISMGKQAFAVESLFRFWEKNRKIVKELIYSDKQGNIVKKSCKMAIRFPADIYIKICNYCDENGCKKGDLVTQAMLDNIADKASFQDMELLYKKSDEKNIKYNSKIFSVEESNGVSFGNSKRSLKKMTIDEEHYGIILMKMRNYIEEYETAKEAISDKELYISKRMNQPKELIEQLLFVNDNLDEKIKNHFLTSQISLGYALSIAKQPKKSQYRIFRENQMEAARKIENSKK